MLGYHLSVHTAALAWFFPDQLTHAEKRFCDGKDIVALKTENIPASHILCLCTCLCSIRTGADVFGGVDDGRTRLGVPAFQTPLSGLCSTFVFGSDGSNGTFLHLFREDSWFLVVDGRV